MKHPLTTLALFCLLSTSAHAGGPWPQAAGNGFFKLSEWWIIFDQHYTDAGQIDPNVTTGIFNTSFYGEYGITDRWTGIVNANLFSRNYMNNLISNTTGELIQAGEAINTLGDIDVAVKYGLRPQGVRVPMAISLTLGIPTGQVSGGSQGNLQTGDGEFNQLLQYDIGTSFKLGQKTNSYLGAYVGFNNRSNGFSEEFRYGLEWGLGLADSKLWLIGRLNTVESLKNGDTAATTNSTSIFANNTEFSSAALEVNYYLSSNWGISSGIAGAFRGEIIAAAPSYSFGIFYDLRR